MGAIFDAYDVEVFALSKDDVASAAAHRERDALSISLLADPALDVIRRYGVEHHKALEWAIAPTTILGAPIALPSGYKSMAIPTTLLIDERGVVQWIDQTDDYRVRGDEARIVAALEAVFGGAPQRANRTSSIRSSS